MQNERSNFHYNFSQSDQDELQSLVNCLELSTGTKTIFAIAPESEPQHPVIQDLKLRLQNSAENFQFQDFFYSHNTLYNFIYGVEPGAELTDTDGRRVVMAFGIEQLPRDRMIRELKQLNLGRDLLFKQRLVLIFWLNKESFLEEFRNFAPDFWDWRGHVVRFVARPPANPLLYPYLEWLIAENSYLKISRVMQVHRQVDIFLNQIYVSLQGVRQQQITETSELERYEQQITTSCHSDYKYSLLASSHNDSYLDEPSYYEPVFFNPVTITTTTKTVKQKINLSEAVRENQYSVILGDPGAGKTTLLRFLALHFAIAKSEGKEIVIGGETQEKLGKSLLPIFFRIADYAERLQHEPDLSLLDYLRQFYRQWEAYFQDENTVETEMGTLFLEKMRLGQCLMLLDGLDEVFDQENRRLIVERIDKFVNTFPANKFVITSRIAGYRDVKLSSRFAEFTIEAMENEQVEDFLQRWCLAIEKGQQPEANEAQWQRAGLEQAKKISAAIQENEGIKRLTANPLLLTILALIHRNGERLPNNRVKLYELAVQTLTEDWQLGKELPDATKVLLKPKEVIAFLAPLAYWMHEEKPSGVVPQAEVEQKLAEKLAELNDTEPESDLVRRAVQEFLRKVRETTGLFVERAPGVYGFMHLTFEEYFAALYIADNEQDDILEIIHKHLLEPRWNEPILLALGYYGTYSNKLANKLIEKLFSNLDAYNPVLQDSQLKIKNASSPDAAIVYSDLYNEEDTDCNQVEIPLRNLLFAGDVLTQVEVDARIRKKIIQKLVITFLKTDFDNNLIKQILRILRQIESFNNKGEVKAFLGKIADEYTNLDEDIRIQAKAANFYVVCGESGAELIKLADEIIHHLDPNLFIYIASLMNELGEEITPNLEISKFDYRENINQKNSLDFMIAISYMRTDEYDKSISLLNQINIQLNEDAHLIYFVHWALACCYQQKGEYKKADDYFIKSRMTEYPNKNALLFFWIHWGYCNLLCSQYQSSLEYFQNSLEIARELKSLKDEANIFYNIGRVYKDWGKYESAITQYQQSRDIYEQLGQEKNVANQWYWLGDCYQAWGKYEQAIAHYQKSSDLYEQLGQEQNVSNRCYNIAVCYREWGKYEPALEYELKDLEICQKLENKSEVALAYYQLGRIYQAWGKYEQAITHYQQSRDLYQQLDKQQNIANQWYWLGDCYREWGKYQQAIDSQQQCLATRQKLENKSDVALAYYQLGRIYQAWGKYEEAIAQYQQSRDLYQQLDKQQNIANQWYWLGDCYREWGKYQQAIDSQHQCLAIRQKLENQSDMALSYSQLGGIYQAWGKYEQAITHYQQSRDLYEQLGQEKDVANLWYWSGDCYREWGKYQQAIDSQHQCLAISQKLENQSDVALGYSQLGRIYQAWGKYEQAIAHYQQSCDINLELGKEQSVSVQWYKMAMCYREWGKYEQALECELKDLEICQKLENKSEVALAYYQLGQIYQAWGKYEQAIAHHQQSLDLYEQLGKQQNVANQWINIADCYRDWGRYEPALEHQQQGLTLRQKLEDPSLIALSYYQLGRVYQEWGKYEQAIAQYQQSCDLYEQLGTQQNVANQLYWMGDCYREWGRYQEAVDCQQECLAIRQNLENQSGIASVYYQLGQIYKAWGKYEQAIAQYQQSRDLYEQLGQEQNVANQYYSMAVCYREWGKYESALECELKDLEICQKLENKSEVALAYSQLGQIYQAWGKYEQAITHYQQSRDLYQQLGKEQNVANQFYSMAVCYREWGKYESALECEIKDLEICQKLENKSEVALAYSQLGQIYQAWGKYEEAIAQYQQSCDLYEQLGQEQNVSDQCHNIAVCYREWGQYEQMQR